MHVDFDPLKVDWSHFAGPINRLDAMVLGMSGGGGGNTASSASYPVFTGLPYQRGAGGLGSMFRSFLRILLPIGRQAGAAIGRQGLESGSRVLSQVLEGRDLKDSLVNESKAGLKNLLEKAAENVGRQKGSGSGGTFDFKRYRRHLGDDETDDYNTPTPLRTMSCPKKISEQSELAFNSALNVFAVPPTNVSVNRSFFRELLPLSTISQEGPYLFRMFNDSLWSDMSRVYLFLELGIVEVQNTELYDSGTLYPYKAYMTNELSFPASVKGHFMASSGYHPSLKHDDATDAGFIARCRRFAGGRKARFISRLDFDLGNQELYLLNNMDVLFTIYRAKDAFLLHCLAAGQNNGTNYGLYLHDIKLYVKMVEVQPSLNMSIYKTLERQPATYAVRKTEMKSVYLSAGRTEMEYNIFSAAIPRRVTIALVLNRAFNGDLAHSPFNFRPYSIRDISVHAAGQTYPAVPYRMNFADAAYIRPFVDMYEALGMANSERSMDITLDQFQDGWTFFVVPLTSTLDDSCGFELLRSGTTSIRLQFNNDIPAGGVEMLVLGEFDQLIMIDYNRHIVSDSKIA
uniref:VP1 n=1 Tax=Globodera pallida TaxID=36090 RepID=A0A183BRD7_GLOPA